MEPIRRGIRRRAGGRRKTRAAAPPLLAVVAPAGFPSPADDYLEGRLDLNEHLIEHPAATFFIRVRGDSMTGAGIHSGDILVVDRAVPPSERSVVVAVVNGELLVKRVRKTGGRITLVSEGTGGPSVEVGDTADFAVWGVVRYAIHAVR